MDQWGYDTPAGLPTTRALLQLEERAAYCTLKTGIRVYVLGLGLRLGLGLGFTV